jgi:hypothetical protein
MTELNPCTNCSNKAEPGLTYQGKPYCKECWRVAGYTPNYPKAEWHLTYHCTLACRPCSRACFLAQPHTGNMTVDDAREFIAQATALNWNPGIILIGGEPTLHPQFLEFNDLAVNFSHQVKSYVQVYSNGFTEHSRELCVAAERKGASIFRDEWKKDSRTGNEKGPEWDKFMYVSPLDAGITFEEHGPCYCHSSKICGVGVDRTGYSICPIGLFFARLFPELKDTVTNDLSNIFCEEWAENATRKQCEICGYMFHKHYGVSGAAVQKFREYAKSCPIIHGMPMSPTWEKVFKGKIVKKCKQKGEKL